MGGFGSGRSYWYTKKTTVEECRVLSIFRFNEEGLLEPGTWRSGSWVWTNTRTGERTSSLNYTLSLADMENPWLRLEYRFKKPRKGEEDGVSYRIDLQTTPCHFGGVRWWFTCPLSVSGRACQRRCGKLYLPPGGTYYGCRECYDLTYTSSQEAHKFDRLYATIADQMDCTLQDVKRALNGNY